MNLQRVNQHIQRIDSLVARIDSMEHGSEIQSDLSRYLCVVSHGLLEQSVETLYCEYAKSKSHARIYRYMNERSRIGSNFSMETLLQTVGGFDQDWEEEIRKHPDFDQLKSGIDSLRSLRNQVAHGENTGVSYVLAKDYLKSVKSVVRIIQDQCTR